eukprot:TRINITY_DN43486_c0_g1_i1.p1 TRINITY_DN43486_c0_g1~~TRINITY_DN43486_c0_g1_i1.p1  ORF type:complete len:389 (-),score=50.07 TRINITY_DN43486_c0_g1_i1:56-1063(-)
MEDAAEAVSSWKSGEWTRVSLLQEAVRNHGRVDLMQRVDGSKYAVKCMPNRWIRRRPKEFVETYPSSSELPWVDVGIVRYLNSVRYPYACELFGIFRDNADTYVTSSLATVGDLFSWVDSAAPPPGEDREAAIKPIMLQLFSAIHMLHEVGIAHRDVSLENVLLTEGAEGVLKVKVIDFGMATLSRTCKSELRGKASYQAPEMHAELEYDAFLTDAFALGVVVFALAASDYPWTSTKLHACKLFDFISECGFIEFLKKRKLRIGRDAYLIEVFSPDLAEFVEGLLEIHPDDRLCLGESCFSPVQDNGRKSRLTWSAWQMVWMQQDGKRRANCTVS